MENKNQLQLQDAGPLDEGLNLRQYWHVILERRWLVLTAFISVFVLCLIYLYRAERVYQAWGLVEISREYDNVFNTKDNLMLDTREQDYLQTQYKKLKSRTLIDWVITQLKLDQDPRYARATECSKAVMEDIQIVPIRFSRLVEVHANHTSPKMAAEIVNKLIEKYESDNLTQRQRTLNKALIELGNSVSDQQQKVGLKDKQLEAYRKEINNVSVEEKQDVDLLGLKSATEQMALAQGKATNCWANDQEVKKMLESGVSLLSIPQVANDRVIQEAEARLIMYEAELDGLLQTYTTNHPKAIEKIKSIETLKQKISLQATSVIATIHSDAVIASQIAAGVGQLYSYYTNKILSSLTQRMKYEQMSKEADLERTLYIKALEAQNQLQLSIDQKQNNIQTVDEAQVPLKFIKPRIMLTLFMGFFGGLAVAIGLAFFVNYLDDSIKTQDDVEQYLRLPFLGYVPNIKSNSVIERDLQSHVHPQSTAAEGFRTIRAAVALMPKAERYRLLVVTSTIPSEGKSLLASNLAIVTAQTGLKTLLVDADLRRPSVHKAFQLHSPVGLSAYLTDNVGGVEEIIHNTEVPCLDVVCAGAIPSNPSELCGSKRMRQFLQEMMRRYDRIFVDCPPVSAVSDPLVIAAMSDGVVFLTKFNKIRREHARKSVQRIQDAGIHLIGAVLNDIDFEGKDSYYYSYYYYQNRYYASHYRTDAKGNKTKDTAEKS